MSQLVEIEGREEEEQPSLRAQLRLQLVAKEAAKPRVLGVSV